MALYEYREQLRNVLNRRIQFGPLAERLDMSRTQLEDLIELRAHVPIQKLQALLHHLGGELAIRPERTEDLAASGLTDSVDTSSPVRRTRDLRIDQGYERTEILDEDLNLLDLGRWAAQKGTYWISCQKKCPAAPHCPFAAPRSPFGPADDRRCGVMSNAVVKFVAGVGTDLNVRGHSRLQKLVDAGLRYGELALLQAQFAAMMCSPNYDVVPTQANSVISTIRRVTDLFYEQLANLYGGLTRPVLWVVEGRSEEVFFGTLLRELHGGDFSSRWIKNIGGIGQLANLRLLLEDRVRAGYEPLIVIDKATGLVRRLDDLVRRRLVRRKNIIQFRKDFESSFPAPALRNAFSPLVGESRLGALETALGQYRRRTSNGFSFEFQAALRHEGVEAAKARKYVEGLKTRAARSLGLVLRPHIRQIVLEEHRNAPEIIRVVRRVVSFSQHFSRRKSPVSR